MLQIQNISKQYKTGDLVQNALNGVSLNFRDNEFVSILGPSGSGKTTLLNIIGGLDRYDDGDLIINDVSTKNYSDRDWDSYRNHTIGFVFQSYNLIPHQTVLSNVELALTISGISASERKERALEALDKVGLKDQAHKKPNQMSGGQMQRVAIARALVNNPDILLADEPTGALDTVTSVQVMDLLKEVAQDRLVIMVTHNPELAEEYSTRIVKLKDGKIIDDSAPFNPNELEKEPPKHKNLGKAFMSFATALSLSLNNLMTKKGRTILTAFAGSIGIIGIALILSLSTGFHNYINQIQEETLTSYPLTLYSETADLTSALLSMVSETGEAKGNDVVEEKQYISTMFSSIGSNDLKSFKKHLEENDKKVDELTTLVQYTYSVKPVIYTIDCNDEVTQLNPSSMLEAMSGGSTMMMGSAGSVFNEMLDEPDTLKEQYDVLAGEWPDAYDEAIIVLTEPNGITDLLVYSLGLRDDSELRDMLTKLMAGEEVEKANDPMEFTYDELLDISLKVVDASAKYKYNSEYDLYEDMSGNEEHMKKVYDEALDLKIVGIVSAKEGSSSTSLMPGVGYTKELTEYVIAQAEESEIVKKQLENKDVNVFSGKRFDEEAEEAGLDFQDMISVDGDMLASAFGGNISEKEIAAMTKQHMANISGNITADTSKAENAFNSTFVAMVNDMLRGYEGQEIAMADIPGIVGSYTQTANYKTLISELQKDFVVPSDAFATVYSNLLNGALQGYIAMEAVTAPEPDNNTEGGASDDANAEGDGETTDGSEEPVTPPAPPSIPYSATVTSAKTAQRVPVIMQQAAFAGAAKEMGKVMTEAVMQKNVLTEVGEMTGNLMGTMASAFTVDQDKIAAAFQFDMSEEEIARLMEAMTTSGIEHNADTNVLSLGYQDLNKPTAISFYFKDFDAKEEFVDFLDTYNEDMEEVDEEKVINYTDITGILMSSVSTIVDSVTYVLIAFVSISLIVSSIMIGIITYISVLERTKEIGILRAIGASKKNISSIFNAETFIVGLFSGLIGIGVTLALIPLINYVIHSVTDNYDINAVLPVQGAVTLVVLSVILTLISGLIPSRQAAKKDPVLALRSE